MSLKVPLPRALSFALFFGIALSLVGAVHYYAWARLVRDPAFPPGVHRALTLLAVLLFVSLPATLIFARQVSPERARLLAFGGFSWLGMLLFLLVTLAAADLGLVVYALVRRLFLELPPADPERRLALSRLFAGGVALVAGGMGAAAVHSGLTGLFVREVKVRLARLPRELAGTTIVQLTDVHVGPTIGKEFIETIVRRTNELEPDVVAITGDLVDGSVEQLRDAVEPLSRLKARHGVYFVTGNHEYYSGVERWCSELRRLGIRVLRNERVSIGDADKSFDLAGIDDYNAHQFGRGHGADLPRALAGRDPNRELVLLAHQPRAIHEAARLGVGLQLSGHTHGGQMWPWKYMVRLQQPVVSGLKRFGQALVYVSNGTGYWGPPMRLGAPAEITRIVLLPEDGGASETSSA